MSILEEAGVSNHITWNTFVDNTTSGGVDFVPEGCVLKQVSELVPWDNQHNLIPKKVEVIVNLLVSGICLPLCFLVSFATNVVNMVVFYKQGLKERVNMCLFSLSLLDLLYVAVVYGLNSSIPYMFIKGKGTEIGPSEIFFFKTHLQEFTI
ncbi:hypothetical protein ACOMHN_057077 [Nucella lapillus]